MLFSVIVPIYNVENYLRECINSIINQIRKNNIDSEIILIDDGSTDMSGRICDIYFEEYPDIIRVLHKKNEGLLCTRRRGFLLARGEYILNCDSDDVLSDNALPVLKNMIDKFQPDILIYNMGVYNGTKKTVYYNNCFTNAKYTKIEKEQVMNSYFVDDVPVVTSMAGKAIKRSSLDLNKDYSEFFGNSFGEDTLQSAEVYENAENIIYINEVLYYYRILTGMSSEFKENYYDNFLQIIKYVSTYQYISKNDKYHFWFTVKMLKTLARSITQSKNSKFMNYKERKNYLTNLSDKEYVKEILADLDKYKNSISPKYWAILFAFKHKLFLCLHVLLSI